MSHAVVVDDLQLSWPDGDILFDGLSSTVGPGRIALVGANGSGRSTLLRLIAGGLVATGGSVRVAGRLGYLRQDLTLDRLGLGHLDLDRRVGTVSGGEAALLGLAFLRGLGITRWLRLDGRLAPTDPP